MSIGYVDIRFRVVAGDPPELALVEIEDTETGEGLAAEKVGSWIREQGGDHVLRIRDPRELDGEAPIPAAIRRGLAAFAIGGHLPGGFLSAILSGDLGGAVARADAGSFQALRRICRWVWNRLPSEAWGTEKAMKAWRDSPGRLAWIQGRDEADLLGEMDR